MNKFLVIFDGKHFSEGSLLFAKNINEQQPILLTGIFLPSVDYSEMMKYYVGRSLSSFLIASYDDERTIINKNIARFKVYCEKYGIEHTIHDEIKHNLIDELVLESRYADLLIISSDLLYENLGPATHEDYVEEINHFAECPVLIVPETYSFPNQVVIAFDGTESALYAIKQYFFALPFFTDVETTIVYASEKTKEIPDLPYIKEYAARHLSNVSFYELDVDPKKYFDLWIVDEYRPMLVTGSFGRSWFSQMLRKSFTKDVLNEHKIPVFIAHK